MANINFTEAIIAGRLTAAPELRHTPSQTAVTSFTVAVNSPHRDTPASFIDCVAWRGTAEFITRYFTKGSSILLRGALQNRSRTDKNGVKRFTTEVVADRVFFVDSLSSDGAGDGAACPVCEVEYAEQDH